MFLGTGQATPRTKKYVTENVRAKMDSNQIIKLRIATANDAEFAFNTTKETMRGYAVATWGEWHEKDSHECAIRDTQSGKIEIIEVNEKPVGVFLVNRNTNEIEIEQIYILPEYQNKGIGSKLIVALRNEVQNLTIPLKLHVLVVNPAYKLYERLGFNTVKETNERRYMEFRPK